MKYVLGVLGFIILTVIAVVLLNSATGDRNSNRQEGQQVVSLTDYIENGTVAYTADGKIVAAEDHKSIRIIVTPTERRVKIMTGYNGEVVREERFSNNSAAFDAFMRALARAGYTNEREVPNTDIRGTCSRGKRYSYSLHQDGTEVTNLWSTSCSAREGTFGGSDNIVQNLFEDQIPDYDDIVQGIRL